MLTCQRIYVLHARLELPEREKQILQNVDGDNVGTVEATILFSGDNVMQ
jgi:hypothetical protein